MPEKKRPLNCPLVVLAKRNQQDQPYFLIAFNETITLVGYEIITDPTRAHGIIVKYRSSLTQENYSGTIFRTQEKLIEAGRGKLGLFLKTFVRLPSSIPTSFSLGSPRIGSVPHARKRSPMIRQNQPPKTLR